MMGAIGMQSGIKCLPIRLKNLKCKPSSNSRRRPPLTPTRGLDRFCGRGRQKGPTRMSNARILVTGGSGFIGSSLVKTLLRTGCSVRVLDDNSRGRARRLSEVANDIEFIAGDVRDAAAVENAA